MTQEDLFKKLIEVTEKRTVNEEMSIVFAKLDKALALLTQEVGYIRKALDENFEAHSIRLNTLEKRVSILENWKIKLLGICIGVSATVGFISKWIWDIIKSKF